MPWSPDKFHFNTSHVSINRSRVRNWLLPGSHFNTSHVSINLIQVINFCIAQWISIHLMFLLIISGECEEAERWYFNTSHVSINQVLFCTGKHGNPHFNTSHVSINPNDYGMIDASKNFNTSHVSINPYKSSCIIRQMAYFNTSHVSINQIRAEENLPAIGNFNTSHVSINPGIWQNLDAGNTFQYISCFY